MIELIPGIDNTASALAAERVRMDVIAQNIANAHTTRGPDGAPYQRRQVAFEPLLKGAPGGVGISSIFEDSSPGPSVYNPHHPHADAEGMVTLTNVQMPVEMVDLIASSRAYEANLSVVRTSRQMAEQTLGIGK